MKTPKIWLQVDASVEYWLECPAMTQQTQFDSWHGQLARSSPSCLSSLSWWSLNGYLGTPGEDKLWQSQISHVSQGNWFLLTTGSKGHWFGDEHRSHVQLLCMHPSLPSYLVYESSW